MVLPLGLWGTADTISLSTSAYLPLGLVPRPAVGTEVVWGRRATSVLAAQVLTSPPKYFRRAKLGCRAWLRLLKLRGLWAGLLTSALLTACCAGSRAAGCWGGNGILQGISCGPWGASHIAWRKGKEEPCEEARVLISAAMKIISSCCTVNFFSTAWLLVSCIQLYAILMVSCSYVFKRKWRGTKYFFCI